MANVIPLAKQLTDNQIPESQYTPILAKAFSGEDTQAAPVSEHLAHTLTTADGMGGPVFPAPPQVKLDPDPLHEIEGHEQNRLIRDYAKDATPWGSPTNHPGIGGKIAHALSHATGGDTRRQWEEDAIAKNLQGLISNESQNAERGAQTGHLEEETKNLETSPATEEEAQQFGIPVGTPLNVATRTALGKQAGTNQTRLDVGAAHNQTLEDIAAMHQATQRAFQHVAGTSGGKDMYANYDPQKGVFTDLAGNVLTDFKPKDKAMQGAYGQYGPMRLAGQLLTYASNNNPALIPVLAPVISHMISGAGGGNAEEMQGILGKIPEAQPQNEKGEPIGLRMPGAPTGTTRNRGQFAEAVLPAIDSATEQIKTLRDKLGPMAGRYQELVTGKIGAYGPEFSGLQTTLHNTATAWMRMHADSEAARRDFVETLRGAKDPDNLIANLTAIRKQVSDYVKQGQGRGGQWSAPEGAPAAPAQDGKYLYDQDKKPVAKSQGGKWVQP